MLFAAIIVLPTQAYAQYKNTAFGIDVGYTVITRPSILNADGSIIYQTDQRPDRMAFGQRLGGEYDFKLHTDHWWFTARLNANLFEFMANTSNTILNNYDAAAKNSMGTLLGAQGVVGPRYVLMTDHIRPYLQLGVSYMYLFSFSGNDSNTCTDSVYCLNQGTVGDNFLPHTSIFALHFEPGVEFIVMRDVAIHVIFELQDWLIFNGPNNYAFTTGLGITFFG